MASTTDLSLEGLTAQIASSSKVISECISQNNLPTLSFDADGPATFSIPFHYVEAQRARQQLIEAVMLLERLVRGPNDYSYMIASGHFDAANLRTLFHFGAFAAVPIDAELTYAELAKKIGIDEGRTRHLIQFAIANGFFDETTTGHVKHSVQSASIAKEEEFRSLMEFQVDDVYLSAAKHTDLLISKPIDNEEMHEAGFPLAFNTDKAYFDYITNVEPERNARFAKAMGSLSRNGGTLDGAHVLSLFDWASLDKGTTVVDVGGGRRGQISILIAEAAPALRFLVQDYETTIESGQENLPSHLAGRIDFMTYSFFKPQPADLLEGKGNVVFFQRFILHGLTNKYCINVLRNMIPGLKAGSTVLLNECVLQPLGTIDKATQKYWRTVDMQMMALVNARQRTAQEFEELLKAADARFKLVKIHRTHGSPCAIMEVRFV